MKMRQTAPLLDRAQATPGNEILVIDFYCTISFPEEFGRRFDSLGKVTFL